MLCRLPFLLAFMLASSAACFGKLKEKDYQLKFAEWIGNAQVEVVAADGTRCDVLTEKYAIEVDFAKKWAEAIGQALHYSKMFERQGGILLIIEGEKDAKYVQRVQGVIEYFSLPIKVWTISINQP